MPSIRTRLRAATEATHLALHAHPLLRCLTDPGISHEQYKAVLTVFYRFYFSIEAARVELNVWPRHGLRQEVDALRKDLVRDLPWGAPGDLSGAGTPSFGGNTHYILGALYVAHGSGFGRASFRKSVMGALPDLPHHFLSHAQQVASWQDLLRCLEHEGRIDHQAQDIERGAADAFDCMSKLADRRLVDA